MNGHEQVCPHLFLFFWQGGGTCPCLFLTRTKPKVPRGWFENCLVHLYTPTMIGWIVRDITSPSVVCSYAGPMNITNRRMLGAWSKFRSSHGNIPRAHITEAKHWVMLGARCIVYQMLRRSPFFSIAPFVLNPTLKNQGCVSTEFVMLCMYL